MTSSPETSQRRLRRLFSDQDLSTDTIRLSSEESRHALKSLRLVPGDRCLLSDGKGTEAEAVLESSGITGAFFKVLSRSRVRRGFPIPVTILPAFIKKGKMDILAEKAQEFGAACFRPLISEHSEFEISADKFEGVAARWEKIAREAAKQSGASQVLEFKEPVRFSKLLGMIPEGALVLFFHPHPPAQDWTRAAEIASSKKYSEALILLGPEGGFSEREVEAARQLKNPDLYFVSMGETVLRADTAFAAALAGLSFFIKGIKAE